MRTDAPSFLMAARGAGRSTATFVNWRPLDAVIEQGAAVRRRAGDDARSRAAEVTVSGVPHIELDVGGETRRATLAASQGTSSRIAFEYEVQSGDADHDGVGISANSLRLNGGDIHDRAGNLADLSYDTVAADPAQRVSTSIEGAGSSAAAASFDG